jgi:hypothetical protein
MKPLTALLLLVTATVYFVAMHLHDEARRYDVVVAGAGSGGSQDASGETDFRGYLVDHKTGRVWVLMGTVQGAVKVVGCSRYTDVKETQLGCEAVPDQKPK